MMIFEENDTWAIPIRPLFLIMSTPDKDDRSPLEDWLLNMEREFRCRGMLSLDTRLTCKPIPLFDSLDDLWAEQKRREDAEVEREARFRGAASLLGK